MKDAREMFAEVKDPRHQGYVKHKLADILILVMGAVVCGITELADMVVYFENKLAFYTKHYGITKVPSKPTLSRILNMIDDSEVSKDIVGIMKNNAGNIGNIIAVDGKAIKSTGIEGQPHSFLQIITAYLTESGVVLGQESIEHNEKTNEIPVFQEMLDNLEIKGKTITADALHCQKETCKRIREKGGDYLFGLKENQKNMYNDVSLFFSSDINKEDWKEYATNEMNGGRIEKRTCRVTDNIHPWLTNVEEWDGLATVSAITRTVTKKKGTKEETTTEETSYYISSLPCDAENILRSARQHWQIESMHWSLDVIWNEDDSGILSDNGNKVLNVFRKLALLAHKRYVAKLKKKKSVKSNVLSALLNDDVAFAVLQCL